MLYLDISAHCLIKKLVQAVRRKLFVDEGMPPLLGWSGIASLGAILTITEFISWRSIEFLSLENRQIQPAVPSVVIGSVEYHDLFGIHGCCDQNHRLFRV